MRYGKVFIGLFTALFILAAVIFGKSEYAWDGTVGITARLAAQDGTEEVRCWEMDDEEFCLFLPSYADLSQVQLKTNVSNTVYLNGREITQGMIVENLQLDVPYDLCYTSRGKEYHYSLTFLQSANMPALYIDTASGNMEHIHEEKGNEEPGTLRLYTADGTLDHKGNLDEVKGRGNSTWDYEKKPYNLTLSTAADLLGMGAAQRWILLANAADASNLKNKLAYDLARDAGLAYTPECEWVDLYLNGEYAGLYLLSERNEVHEERVNIPREGSFLVGKDWEWRFQKNGDPFVMTMDRTALRIYYSDLPEEELLAILQSAENAILSGWGYDPVTEKNLQELIDVDSWALKYLVEEVLGNVDASTLSQFYYYNGSDGKLYAGPVWDMDLILRDSDEPWLENVHQFYGNKPHVYGSHWLHALYNDEFFYSRVTQLYETVLQPLLDKLLDSGIDAYCSQIKQAAKLNQIRWEAEDPEKAAAVLWKNLESRTDFFTSLWVEKEDYVIVTVNDIENDKRSFAVRSGECVQALPEYESDESTRILGWYYLMTEIPFDISQPVTQDIEIEIRYELVTETGESA